jgi:chromosomal replication initiator protein
LWQSVLGEIEVSVSHATFMTWFKNTELLENNQDRVTIAVPNIFAQRQFEVKFNDQIRSILEKNGVTPTSISYIVKTNHSITRDYSLSSYCRICRRPSGST